MFYLRFICVWCFLCCALCLIKLWIVCMALCMFPILFLHTSNIVCVVCDDFNVDFFFALLCSPFCSSFVQFSLGSLFCNLSFSGTHIFFVALYAYIRSANKCAKNEIGERQKTIGENHVCVYIYIYGSPGKWKTERQWNASQAHMKYKDA